jgi:NDP-sugar pyrophosphorylase family protein
MAGYGDIESLVLAGGAGTRLRSALPGLPKPLAPVFGRPFVSRVLDRLRSAGVPRAVLCTGHLGGAVREALGDSWRGMALDYSREEEPLGTGGALRLGAGRTSTARLLATNGDSWCDADLDAFLDAHLRSGMPASILLAEVPDASRYGRVAVSRSGAVTGFEEKGSGGPGWINAGVYLIERGLLDRVPEGRFVSLERELFPLWIAGGLHGFRGGGRFIDIGTEASYGEAEAFFRGERRQGNP